MAASSWPPSNPSTSSSASSASDPSLSSLSDDEGEGQEEEEEEEEVPADEVLSSLLSSSALELVSDESRELSELVSLEELDSASELLPS